MRIQKAFSPHKADLCVRPLSNTDDQGVGSGAAAESGSGAAQADPDQASIPTARAAVASAQPPSKRFSQPASMPSRFRSRAVQAGAVPHDSQSVYQPLGFVQPEQESW